MKIDFAPGFKKSWNKLFAWYWAPLRWVKAVMYWPTDIKHAYQRVTRGWSDADTWSMDFHLLKILPEMLRHLKKNVHGCPDALYDKNAPAGQACHKWEKLLEEMASGFDERRKWEQEYVEMLGYENSTVKQIWEDPAFKQLYEIKDRAINERFSHSMDLFKEHFFTLWD